MRVFVLDDSMDRVEWFQSTWGKENVVYTDRPDRAEEILEKEEFDLIFLDHDLGGPYKRGPYGDGIDLAKEMAKKKIQIDTPIIVHSLNDFGSQNMLNVLSPTHACLIRLKMVWLKMKVRKLGLFAFYKQVCKTCGTLPDDPQDLSGCEGESDASDSNG